MWKEEFHLIVLGIFSVLGQMPNPLDLVADLETTDKLISTFPINNR